MEKSNYTLTIETPDLKFTEHYYNTHITYVLKQISMIIKDFNLYDSEMLLSIKEDKK